jgi:hypothetical protein
MHLKIAAIRSGTEPVGRLPGGAFHRWLETPLACPKCDVTYNLVVDWDQANDRWFNDDSGPLIQRLKKAVMMGHGSHHRVTHYETSGVTVQSIVPSDPPPPHARPS